MAIAISGNELNIKVCKALGLDPNLVSRVVLDLDACNPGPIPVYVEMYSNEKLLDIQWSFEGIEINYVGGRPESESTLEERIAELG